MIKHDQLSEICMNKIQQFPIFLVNSSLNGHTHYVLRNKMFNTTSIWIYLNKSLKIILTIILNKNNNYQEHSGILILIIQLTVPL